MNLIEVLVVVYKMMVLQCKLPGALKGVARFYKSKKKHVITTQTEHKCVLDSCRQLEAEGFEARTKLRTVILCRALGYL